MDNEFASLCADDIATHRLKPPPLPTEPTRYVARPDGATQRRGAAGPPSTSKLSNGAVSVHLKSRATQSDLKMYHINGECSWTAPRFDCAADSLASLSRIQGHLQVPSARLSRSDRRLFTSASRSVFATGLCSLELNVLLEQKTQTTFDEPRSFSIKRCC